MTTFSWHTQLANEFIVNPHFSSVCMHAQLLQLCLTLGDPMDCSPPGSFVHETLQTRTLEWVAVPSSRGSSPPRNRTCVSCFAGGFIATETWEVPFSKYIALFSFRCNGHISPGVVVDSSALPKSELWLLLHMEQDMNSEARTIVIQTYWCQLHSILRSSYVYTGSSKLPLKT